MELHDGSGTKAASHLVKAALHETWGTLKEELRQVPLPLWNESVFRHFFIRSLRQLHPGVRCQTEWNRIDLLVQIDRENVLVEFKFYHPSVHHHLSGRRRLHAKGGAGPKNFSEFWACVKKLKSVEGALWRAHDRGHINGRFLILVYAHHEELKDTKAYRYWYDPVRPRDGQQREEELNLLCTLSELQCDESCSELFCKMFAV